MTATPIPRTLALTLYGDLDLSVLDELPPGRTPIVTRRVSDERAPEVWEFVRKQVNAGHQAYVVYPVIEENQETRTEGRAQDVQGAQQQDFRRPQSWTPPRAPRSGTERASDADVPARRAQYPGRDHRD